MPKKKKRDKILADARRIIKQAQLEQSNNSTTDPKSADHTPSVKREYLYKPKQIHQTKPAQTTTDHVEYKDIRQDLIKTIVFAACAIAAVFIISYINIG